MALKADNQLADKALIDASSRQEKTASADSTHRLLTVYELYESNKVQDITLVMAVAGQMGRVLVDEIVTAALDKIVENDFRKRVPDNIIDTMDSILQIGLEMHYKKYDIDREAHLRFITDPDDEPTPIAIDTWARANLPQTKAPSVRMGEASTISLRIPDYKENARRELRLATEKAHKYLTELEDARAPKPIPLNEKHDGIAPDEDEVRRKKDEQIKEKRLAEKKLREEKLREKEQTKLIEQAEKQHGKEVASLITSDYTGKIVLVNHKGAKEKLNSIVHPTKIVLKNPEVERSEAEVVKTRQQQKDKRDKLTLPGIKKVNKIALMEEMMAKTSYTSPNINDVISLSTGVTLTQGGRVKANQNKLELRFNQTGTIRMNKTDYGKMLEHKRILKERRLADVKKGFKKPNQVKKAEEDSINRLENSELIDEDAGIHTRTMKAASVKALRALRDLGPETTLTSFNNTYATNMNMKKPNDKKDRERERERQQDLFMQTNTDTFNMELLRGTMESRASRPLAQMTTTRPGLEARLESKKTLEDKMMILPRNRSQKVLRPTRNIYDLMTPPTLGGAMGHELLTSKTVANFFRT